MPTSPRLLACLAALSAACSSPPAGSDAAADAGSNDASDGATADAAPFVTAMHDPLPVVPDMGGPVLAHPRVVVITYADDPNRAGIETDARWMVGSSWFASTGAEYGVGAGTVLAAIERTDNAPTLIDDADIVSMIAAGVADGSLPGATAGAPIETQPLYVVYFPAQTSVTQTHAGMVVGRSCHEFGGYHGEIDQGGFDVAYAVVDACDGFSGPYVGLQSIEAIASHELFEAATDPSRTQQAYIMDERLPDSPWTIATEGGELGDMCILWPNQVLIEGHVVQRMWSNAAAMAGTTDPCVPASSTAPFYFTSATPDDIEYAAAGDSVVYTLQGWSSGAVSGWSLSTLSYGSQFEPTIALGATSMNNGGTTTLTLGVPAGTARGMYATVLVYSARSRSDYAVLPITLVAN